MRAFALCLGVGILLTATCGGDSKSGTNSNGRDSKTGSCAGSATLTCTGDSTVYEKCVKTNCDAQAKAAFGSGYTSGSFAGACGAMMNCRLACPCDATATTCEYGCYASIDLSCQTAITALTTCTTTAACATPTCTPNTTGISTDTATYTNIDTATYTNLSTATATGGCTAAAQCCTTLAGMGGPVAAQVQQACATISSEGEAACNQALGVWQSLGYCK